MEQHWLARPQRGELIGISASVEGKMIGLAIAEGWWEDGLRQVELLSSYVLPAYRHQPIERQLHQHLQQAMTDVAPDVKS
jgi:ribosomal protein S18 acetylase RimI-like enzyme